MSSDTTTTGGSYTSSLEPRTAAAKSEKKTTATWKFWPNLFAATSVGDVNTDEDDEDEDEIQPEEAGDFPNLFQHLPQFHAVGVAYDNPEPIVVSPYSAKFHNRWLLFVSVPPLQFPFVPSSVREIYRKADKFREQHCDVLFLSLDPWSRLKAFRDTLDLSSLAPSRPRKPQNNNNDGGDAAAAAAAADAAEKEEPKNVYFISDPKGRISGERYFKVFCKNPEADDGTGKVFQVPNEFEPGINYPGYFLLTPDKELVQTAVIKNSGQLFEKSGQVFFGYPITEEVADNLVETMSSLVPVYEAVDRLKENYPKATFGTFMDDMIRRVKTEEAGGKHESLFKWKGWARAAEGVLRGGIK